MRLLLDTHFVLWFAKGDRRVPDELRAYIENPANSIFVSEASLFEVVIKHAKNPAAMPYSGAGFLMLCERACFELRPITRESILAYETLSLVSVGDLHKDPFDRLLIGQAKSEGLILATHDRLMALYGEPSVRVFV